MAETKIITRTTNIVDFKVSKESFDRAKKKIQDVGKAWEKVDQKVQSASRKQLENNKAIIQANNLEAKRLQAQNRLNAAKEKERSISAKTATQRKKETADQLRAESKLQRELGKRFAGQNTLRGPRVRQPLPTAAEMVPAVQGLINAHSPESKANAAKAAAQAMRQAKKEEARLAREAGKAEKRRLDYARRRYLTIRSEAFKIQNIEGLTNAERTEAILKMRRVADQQAKETLNAQETRFELRKITQELQKQARLRRRMANQRTHGGNFGAGRKGGGFFGGAALTGEGVAFGIGRVLSGPTAIAAGGLLAFAAVAHKTAEVLRDSFERQRDYTALKDNGVSSTNADAIVLAANSRGADLSLDKLNQQLIDYRDKQGDLSLGQFKTDKQGNRTYSGGGELSDVINLVESKQKGAGEKVLKRLQSVDFVGYLSYLRELQKQYKLTTGELTLFGEFIDDGSKTLKAFDENGQIAADALNSVKNSSLYLNDAQREQIKQLQGDFMVISKAADGLADNFTLGFADSFSSSKELQQAFENLTPVVHLLGNVAGDVANLMAHAFKWLTSLLPDLNQENTPAEKAEHYTGSSNPTQRTHTEGGLFHNAWETLKDNFRDGGKGLNITPDSYSGKNTQKQGITVPDWLPAVAPFHDLAVKPVPTFDHSKLGNVSSVQMPQTVVVKQEPLQINVKVQDGQVKDLIRSEIEHNDQAALNMLTAGQQ
ncbi:hypothetical protein [Klebsiella aerogenes]|uniref:hypothetical protein n=1 Tax=Klebsiella aerogenes TaxID=548 RepID=UPI001BCD3C3F|nr:hypothetical protein [Klebsiella aerogenes]